ncbi:hypothetical protein GCM10023353_05150 [Tomitella cavernea]|uniref:Uncharacterized protein n=1 Tax=Tomitella cavernea TaxID=1387982 RepID=A0ABP9CAS6_9ACTN
MADSGTASVTVANADSPAQESSRAAAAAHVAPQQQHARSDHQQGGHLEQRGERLRHVGGGERGQVGAVDDDEAGAGDGGRDDPRARERAERAPHGSVPAMRRGRGGRTGSTGAAAVGGARPDGRRWWSPSRHHTGRRRKILRGTCRSTIIT